MRYPRGDGPCGRRRASGHRPGSLGMTAAAIVAALATTGARAQFPGTPGGPGRPDPDFGTGGVVRITPVPAMSIIGAGVAVQRDGKIVVAEDQVAGDNSDMGLWRFNADGTPDPSFGSGGHAVLRLPGPQEAQALAIQRDGRIVIAGFRVASGDRDFMVARFTTNGSPDPSFAAIGYAGGSFGPGVRSDAASAVAIQRDGGIVVAGASNPGGIDQFALARFLPNGTLDRSFDRDGRTLTLFGAGEGADAMAVAIQKDGKIVASGLVSGAAGDDFVLVRYLRGGRRDHGFGRDGIVRTDFQQGSDFAAAIAIQRDGRILAAGSAEISGNGLFALARYLGNGRLDRTFGADGKVLADFGADAAAVVNGLAVQGDGEVVGGGAATDQGSRAFALARFQKSGSPDLGFGQNGRTLAHPGDHDILRSVAVQRDGKIVVSGYSGLSPRSLIVARFLAQ